MRLAIRTLVVVLGLGLLPLLPALTAGPASAALPSEARWHADVRRAMDGSLTYLQRQAARGGKLAINLDIDNTSLATAYRAGTPVGPVLRFAKRAHALGMVVFFNTGRSHAMAAKAVPQLRRAGFTVDGICSRNRGETVRHSKPRCRSHLTDAGYTIVANVGNSATDFTGGGYRRAYRLPNYGGQLS